MQDCGNSSAKTLQLPQSCTKPSTSEEFLHIIEFSIKFQMQVSFLQWQTYLPGLNELTVLLLPASGLALLPVAVHPLAPTYCWLPSISLVFSVIHVCSSCSFSCFSAETRPGVRVTNASFVNISVAENFDLATFESYHCLSGITTVEL